MEDKDWHPLNAKLPIAFNVEGSTISLRESQPEKTELEMFVIRLGILILVNVEQLEKTP